MWSARSALGSVWVRLFLAILLLAASLGGLAVTSYADQYINGGVAWGNNLPAVDNTVDNPLGVNLFLEKEVDPAKVEKTVQMTHDAGIKWVRQVFAWNDIEISAKGDFMDRRGPGQPVSAWTKYDRIVDTLTKYSLQIIARLDSPPNWARIPGDDLETYRKGPPAHDSDYADFVKAVATRYKGKIKYFQIWNEPNLFGEWGGHAVNPAEYTELLKEASIAIKSVIPDAVIITAALAPTAEQSLRNMNDVLYLEGMYQAGAAPYFDVLSTMLYGLGQSPDERRTDLSRLNFSRPILLRQVMEKYNDTRKPVWISEYGWISLPPDFSGDPSKNIWGKSVDEQTQAQWIVQGFERIRQEWPWIGAVCIWFLRDPDPVPGEPANYFAILNQDFTPRPAYNAIKEYSKRFPVADTGKYGVDSQAIATSVDYKENPNSNIIIGNTPPETVLTETISFAGNRLDANLCGSCALSVLSMDGSPPRPLNDTDRSIINGTPKTRGSPSSETLASGLKDVPHKATLLAYVDPGDSSDPNAITLTVSRDKPLLNALGFPLLYGFFGLLALISAGYAAATAGNWVSAALDRPRGRYSEEVREKARNVAVVASMVLLTAVYWKAESLPLILACLVALGLLAFIKPSIGLALVTVTIPLFWYPKDINGQHFPLAETLLLLVFGALMVRRIVAFLLPGVAAALNITPVRPVREAPLPPGFSTNGRNGSDGASPYEEPVTGTMRPYMPVLTEEQLNEILPARWPKRPVTAPLGTTRIQVARVESPVAHVTSKLDTAPLPVIEEDGRKVITTPKLLTAFLPAPDAPAVPWFRTVLDHLRALDRADRFALPALALVLAATIAMLTLANPAFARDSARAYRWVIIEPVLFYFLLTDALPTRRSMWRIADFFVATAVVISFIGIYQYVSKTDTLAVEGVSRVLGVYQHPNNLALYLGRVLPFAACVGIFLRGGWRKRLYLLASVPLAITTFLTFSRGAYIAVTAAILVAVIVGLSLRGKATAPKEVAARDRRVLWASIGAVAAGLLLIGTAALLPKIPQRIFALGSGELRVDLWISSLKMLGDHPIFGVGPDQFLNQFQAHYMTPAQQGESFTAHPHNMLLDYWLTLGIMGVPILLWLLWRYFREAAGRVRDLALGDKPDFAGRALALGLLACMVDFAVHGMVDNSYFLMDLAMIFWLSCALLHLLKRKTL